MKAKIKKLKVGDELKGGGQMWTATYKIVSIVDGVVTGIDSKGREKVFKEHEISPRNYPNNGTHSFGKVV